ncbi:9134_t:CDS:2 [Diversispora eburnea]|uniref:9134_t:CDS:1 n=1 Tax=Diversispora eburnea TaxID=1213867 RepID=A0A9N9C4M1_9GLOM|nr:9134_t:CDS:2 [Diversispora eburnea]
MATMLLSFYSLHGGVFHCSYPLKKKIQSYNNDDHKTSPEEKILSDNDEFISNFTSVNLTFSSIPSISVDLSSINDVISGTKEFFSNITESIKDFVNEHKTINYIVIAVIIGVLVGIFALGTFLAIIRCIGFKIGVLNGSLAASMMSILGTAAGSIVPILQSIGAAGLSVLTLIGFPIFCHCCILSILSYQTNDRDWIKSVLFESAPYENTI